MEGTREAAVAIVVAAAAIADAAAGGAAARVCTDEGLLASCFGISICIPCSASAASVGSWPLAGCLATIAGSSSDSVSPALLPGGFSVRDPADKTKCPAPRPVAEVVAKDAGAEAEVGPEHEAW